MDASDSDVGTRGTFEGRCGLNGGAFRLEAGYTTVSFGSFRGGILDRCPRVRTVLCDVSTDTVTCGSTLGVSLAADGSFQRGIGKSDSG